jgi:hypothetical protein
MAQKGKVQDIDHGWIAFRELLDTLNDHELVVGIVEGATATYAAANEYGVPKDDGSRIPSRPFMRHTIDVNAKRYSEILKRAIGRQIKLRAPDLQPLFVLGIKVRNDMIRTIVSWKDPENALSTQKAKGRKGKPVNNPLVDTGHMQRSIVFEIRRKGSTPKVQS